MKTIGIVANGPEALIPNLQQFKNVIDIWIGADRGAFEIVKSNTNLDYALGDFDSIDSDEEDTIMKHATYFEKYPIEKDQTDIELAIEKALNLKASKIYLFGVTGGRLDHELINIQLLYMIKKQKCTGIIIDKNNRIELFTPGAYQIMAEVEFPNISFIPFSGNVKGITLEGFYYPLNSYNLDLGSTRCISNKLLLNNGTFSFDEGILLLIKSCDG